MFDVSGSETEADQYNQQFLRSINHLTPSMITRVKKIMDRKSFKRIMIQTLPTKRLTVSFFTDS